MLSLYLLSACLAIIQVRCFHIRFGDREYSVRQASNSIQPQGWPSWNLQPPPPPQSAYTWPYTRQPQPVDESILLPNPPPVQTMHHVYNAAEEVRRVYLNHVKRMIDGYITNNSILMFTTSNDPNMLLVNYIIRLTKMRPYQVNLSKLKHGSEFHEVLANMTGHKNGPYLFINGEDISGAEDIVESFNKGRLQQMLSSSY